MTHKNDNPCSICENYINGVVCDSKECPVYRMKCENKRLRRTITNLKNSMTYMVNPNSIFSGQSEMGMW